jgi:hypothetical protein
VRRSRQQVPERAAQRDREPEGIHGADGAMHGWFISVGGGTAHVSRLVTLGKEKKEKFMTSA